MKICSKKHDEICFELNNCPLCEKMDAISSLEDEMLELKESLHALRRTISDMQEELAGI